MTKTTKMYLVLERTPLFFLDEEMQNLTDPLIEVSEEFYNAYAEIESQFKTIQHALFSMFLEQESVARENGTTLLEPAEPDDDDDEDFLNPVHDEPSKTIH